MDGKSFARDVRREGVELAVEMKSAAGNAVRPWDEQVQGEIERSRADEIAAGAEQGRAPGRADKVISGETRAQIRNNDGLGDAVADRDRVGLDHWAKQPANSLLQFRPHCGGNPSWPIQHCQVNHSAPPEQVPLQVTNEPDEQVGSLARLFTGDGQSRAALRRAWGSVTNVSGGGGPIVAVRSDSQTGRDWALCATPNTANAAQHATIVRVATLIAPSPANVRLIPHDFARNGNASQGCGGRASANQSRNNGAGAQLSLGRAPDPAPQPRALVSPAPDPLGRGVFLAGWLTVLSGGGKRP